MVTNRKLEGMGIIGVRDSHGNGIGNVDGTRIGIFTMAFPFPSHS